jgi:Lrp/AsnC family transcriptional regulator, leucine-responsive regulatory protein
MADKIDKLDAHILQILQESSKITNLELSKRIGLSPAPTLERVKKLENSGVIESYHAKVNAQALGLQVRTFVLVSLAWQKENALDLFIKQIEEINEISECYIITGDADFLLKIICKDLASYEKLLFKTLSQIEQIERLKTLMTLSVVKDNRVLPFDYDNGTN